MKHPVQFLLSLSLLATVQTRAATLFFDDFQQFPSGTDLTTTNYASPALAVGLGAEMQTNNDGLASTSVVASNFLGSIRAFFNRTSPTYQNNYRGDPTAQLTNQLLTLSWKLWIQNTNSPATTIGGMTCDLLTTNQDFDGTLQGNPLLIFNDAGQVLVFTNNASVVNPLAAVKQIGSWTSLRGTVMTNQLVLDYPAGTFSFSINGVLLTTNLPIPLFITNIFDRVRMEVFEGFPSGGTASKGNQFALDDVRVTSGAGSTNQDVQSYLPAAKGMAFNQSAASTVTIMTTGFLFHADIRGVESNSIVAATVQPPTGASKPLQRNSPGDSQLEFNDEFTTQNALNSAYHSSGNYTLTVDTQNQGPFTPTLNLPADDYPSTPQISNFTAAQSVNSATNFTLRWVAFTGGGTSDFISVSIDDGQGNSAFNSADILAPGALDGTATAVDIPGGTLLPGTTYQGRLLFIKGKTFDTTSVPGAIGLTGFFKQTIFAFVTIGSPTPVDLSLTDLADANAVGQGSNLTYRVDVTNIGTNLAHNVALADILPAGVAFVSAAPSGGGSCSEVGGVVTCNLGTLAPATSNLVMIVVQVLTNGAICDSASVASQEPDSNSGNNSAGACVTASPPPPTTADLAISKNAVPDPVGQGSNTTYTITVQNNGPEDAGVVTVTDVLPASMLFVSANPSQGTVAHVGSTVTAHLGTVANGASASVDILVTATVPGVITNSASVTTSATDTNSANDTITIATTVNAAPLPNADLAVTKTGLPEPVLVSSNLTYSIHLQNNGPGQATGVTVVDDAPGSVTIVSVPAGSSIDGNTVTCNLGNLSSGASTNLTIVVTPNSAGSITNTVTATANNPDPNSANNTATAVTDVQPVPHDLAIVALKAPKKITLSTRTPSPVGKFSISLQNRGTQNEVIQNFGVLTNLVTVSIQSLSNCPSFLATLLPPKSLFPITLAPKKKLSLAFQATFGCVNDGLATSKTAPHNDFSVVATVHHEAIDGLVDTFPGDDTCPRGPLSNVPLVGGTITDKGCGGKNLDGTLGAPVFIDVIQK